MRVRLIALFLTWCFALGLTPISAEADDWLDSHSVAELNSLVNAYFQRDQRDSALIIAKRAVKKATSEYGDASNETALSLHSQGTLLSAMGQPIAAMPMFERALTIWKTVPPTDSTVLGAAKYNLAVLYNGVGRHASAIALLRNALADLSPRLAPNDPNLAAVYFDLAEAFRFLNQHDSAITNYREALSRQQAGLGTHDLRVARTWNNLGLSLAATEQFQGAEDAYNKALTSLEQVLGADDLEVGYCIENLVSMYVKTRKYEAAGRLASLARDVFEKRLGTQSIQAIEIAYLQGVINHRQKNYKAAEPAYREVRSRLQLLDSREAHQLTLKVLTSLNELYLEIGDTGRADDMQKEIDALAKRLNG